MALVLSLLTGTLPAYLAAILLPSDDDAESGLLTSIRYVLGGAFLLLTLAVVLGATGLGAAIVRAPVQLARATLVPMVNLFRDALGPILALLA